MARGRMLNRKISQDEGVAKLSIKATLLYTWIIPHADIKGRLYGDVAYLKGNIIPHVDDIKLTDIEKLTSEITEAKLIIYYGDKVKYIQLCGWENNQTVYADREAKSEIPEPTDKLMCNSCVNPAKEKLNRREDKRSKEKGTFVPPSLEDVRIYITKKGIPIDPIAMFSHYEANGWVQGHRGKPIVKWQACCYTWLKNKGKFGEAEPQKKETNEATKKALAKLGINTED